MSAPTHTAPIEVAAPEDVDHDEFDACDYDKRSAAEGTSITSSLFEHSYENGRRYHAYKNARYPIPNDDMEQNREDMKHALMLELTDGKLFLAPIGDAPLRIIDLGTGTGVWAIDVADQFPSAQVIGVDFTPIQPQWVPPNLKFLVDDIDQALEYTFLDLATEAFKRFGSDFRAGNKLEKTLGDAGFVNVSVKKLKVPVGPWAKDKRLRLIGLYFQKILEGLVAAIGARPLAALGMTPEEIETLLAAVRRDLKNTGYHTYFEYLFWTAQKPE
ncbi:hypothetical protein OQA88_9977 [Cercophora sp. LCS_1]